MTETLQPCPKCGNAWDWRHEEIDACPEIDPPVEDPMSRRHALTAQRALCLVEIDTDLAHRVAYAQAFLDLIDADGVTHARAWKELDADERLIELERGARRAKADVRAGWWELTELRRDEDRRRAWKWWGIARTFPEGLDEVSG